MTGTRFKKPDMSLKDAVAAAREQEKGQKGVRKQFTSLRTKDASSDGGDAAAYDSGIMRPTDEELAVINTLTRSPKTADEVVVFSTLSCNDLVDRDLDKFPTKTVRDFASLPAPYGSIGKSFMVGHDYSKLPVGRIFDAGVKEIDGATFMTNKVYLPNTEQHKNFIENMDYGVYWAVSVGVMLDDVKCSVCDAHMSSWGGYCFAGHVKGLYYPEGDEGDPTGWDFAEPVKETAKNAVQCIGLMDGARDFFELSQVFLGAQFYAGLEKSPNMKGVLKAASAGGVPIISLSAKEAKELPFQHVPDKVKDAVASYETKTDEEGQVTWTDDKGLVYVYDPETSEVLCLGKSQDDNQEDQNGEGDQPGASGEQEPLGDGAEGEPSVEDDGSGRAGEADGEHGGSDADAEEEPGSDGSVADPDAEATAGTETEEEVTKASVLAALKAAGGNTALMSAVAEAKDNGLSAVLRTAVGHIETLEKQVGVLTPKAALGDEYLKDLTTDAISWYVKSHQVEGKGVSTDSFEKILAACGDNVELIKSLRDEQVTLAQAKFPEAVRRSSFSTDPNERQELKGPEVPAEPDSDNSKRVSRLHG